MSPRLPRRPRGVALLEAIVALAILAASAPAVAWLASESLRSVAEVRLREEEIRAASRFLTAVSLWPREDLDRHLGRSDQGSWVMTVERPKRTLYVVTLSDALSAGVLVATAFSRPEEP